MFLRNFSVDLSSTRPSSPLFSINSTIKKESMQSSISRKMKAWKRDLSSHFPLVTSHPCHRTSPVLGSKRIGGEKKNYKQLWSKIVWPEECVPVPFLKGEYAWLRMEAHYLTFSHHAELCVLFSFRDKACDLNVLRYTFEPAANVNIYNFFFKQKHQRAKVRKCNGGPSCITMTMIG